jgi:hypothetical protein
MTMVRRCAVLLCAVSVLSGCSKIRDVLGIPNPADPTINQRSAETRWLLVQNPRFGDVPSEPEYIWVEEDKVPLTFKTLVRGSKSIIAGPEIVSKYGPPPGGGKISPRQGVVIPSTPAASPEVTRAADRNGRVAAAAPIGVPTRPAGPTPSTPGEESPKRGFVVYVDATRVVIDLTTSDGIHAGSLISLRRDRIPVVHPVTGEVLGTLDEEVATARVTETRDRFSVAEVQSVTPGSQIQIKDRVVPK